MPLVDIKNWGKKGMQIFFSLANVFIPWDSLIVPLCAHCPLSTQDKCFFIITKLNHIKLAATPFEASRETWRWGMGEFDPHNFLILV